MIHMRFKFIQQILVYFIITDIAHDVTDWRAVKPWNRKILWMLHLLQAKTQSGGV